MSTPIADMTKKQIRAELAALDYDWKHKQNKASLAEALGALRFQQSTQPERPPALPPFWIAAHALEHGPGNHGPSSVFRTTRPASAPPGGGDWVQTTDRPAWARYV